MRDCGSCIACCVFLIPSEEPGLIKLERCRFASHEGEFSYTGTSSCGNCTIFDKPERPQMCGDFYCGYLKGEWDERPNATRDSFLDVVLNRGKLPDKFPGFLAIAR